MSDFGASAVEISRNAAWAYVWASPTETVTVAGCTIAVLFALAVTVIIICTAIDNSKKLDRKLTVEAEKTEAADA